LIVLYSNEHNLQIVLWQRDFSPERQDRPKLGNTWKDEATMLTTLTARRLSTETGQIDHPVLTIEDGRIVSIESGEPNGSSETLTAAFFDIHVHGACSYDFMAASLSEVAAVGRYLASCGVGYYLPTTVTGPIDTTLRALDTLACAIEEGVTDEAKPKAVPVGIHLEGPFISHAKRGVHPPSCIQESSIELFERFRQAARGHIRLMTIAPGLPCAAELIEHVTRRGVRVSMGHSNATASETLAAIAAGATSSTHLFNAMRALDHREPGIIGTILDRDDIYAEAICDGVHVHPAIVRLWLKMKGAERAILVTDGMSATGMPDGNYMLGDFSVQVKDGVCLSEGALAGSVLTMNKAVENLQLFTGAPLATAVQLASRNPARMLGLEHLVALSPGAPADFNRYNEAGERLGTILHGRKID
jgi:N-acetylglucosamine-6-phosphate deacetylase